MSAVDMDTRRVLREVGDACPAKGLALAARLDEAHAIVVNDSTSETIRTDLIRVAAAAIAWAVAIDEHATRQAAA